MLLNAALAEGLHCEEGNSPRTTVTVLHEVLPLPQQPPSKKKKKKSKFITPRKEQKVGVRKGSQKCRQKIGALSQKKALP